MAVYLLAEDGDFLLFEDGSKILLSGTEDNSVSTLLIVELTGNAN